METFQNKMGLKGCKWSSLNAPGLNAPLSVPYWKLQEFFNAFRGLEITTQSVFGTVRDCGDGYHCELFQVSLSFREMELTKASSDRSMTASHFPLPLSSVILISLRDLACLAELRSLIV